MKKTFLFLFPLLYCFSGFSQFGIYATAAYIKIEGNTLFYNCMAPGNGQDIGGIPYQGNQLGTYYQGAGTLSLTGGEIKSYKGPGDNVCSGILFFTFYHNNQRPANPTFTSIGLGFFSNCTDPVCGNFPNAFPLAKGGGCCNGGDQKWQYPGGGSGGGNNGDIDLTANPPGNYTLEIYYQATGQDGSSGCADSKYDGNNNNPTNYTANFSIAANLPVHFGNISAVNTQQTNSISWTTLTEQNTRHFIIERSGNGSSYNGLAQVAAAGNSSAKKLYAYVDKYPLKGLNFYRIQMVENGGEKTYSPVALTITGTAPGKALIYPNPASRMVRFYAPGQNSSLVIYNSGGSEVFKAVLNGQFYNLPVTDWPNGSYFARITSASSSCVLPFIVSK